MRGLFYRQMRLKAFAALVLWAALLCVINSQSNTWVKVLAEEKLSQFAGGNTVVRVEDVNGGVFRDMVLENVSFGPAGCAKKDNFTIERIELSYRLWRPVAERLGLTEKESALVRGISVYFSPKNPFVRGYVSLAVKGADFEVNGSITPVLAGVTEEAEVKGSFKKRDNGTYVCDILLGDTRASGLLDPDKRSVELEVTPACAAAGCLKIKASVNGEKGADVYCRADKLTVSGREIIGDAWLSYRHAENPGFSLKAENLVVDKRPYWDLSAEGIFRKKDKTFEFKDVKIGDSLTVNGTAGVVDPYGSELKVMIKGLELAALAEMIGETKMPVKGLVRAELTLEGPLKSPFIKGRLSCGEGYIGNLRFRSIYGALAGKYPVIKVLDSRIVQQGGSMTVSKEADFSRPGGNKFEALVFGTENAPAFFNRWQIFQGSDPGTVAASKDNVTLKASLREYGSSGEVPSVGTKQEQNEVGVKYKIDPCNSVKIESDENRDLIGVEHKIQF